MKINHISASEGTDGAVFVNVRCVLPSLPLSNAVAFVEHLLTGEAPPVLPADQGGVTAEPVEVPTRRRRSATEEPATAEAAPEATTRRRRSATEAPPAEPEPETAAPVIRRRRAAEAEPEKDPEITDADLTRAASDAAAVCGTALVTALLAEFNVALTGQIDSQEDRKEFLDLLKQNIAEFKASKGE
jgi:hypothetical protein